MTAVPWSGTPTSCRPALAGTVSAAASRGIPVRGRHLRTAVALLAAGARLPLLPAQRAAAQGGLLGRIKRTAVGASPLGQIQEARDAMAGMRKYREAEAALARTPSLVAGTYAITVSTTGAGGTDSVVFYARTLANGRMPLATVPDDPAVSRAATSEDVDYGGGYLLNVVAAPSLAELPATFAELRNAGGPKGGGMFMVAYRKSDAGDPLAYRAVAAVSLAAGQSAAFDRIATQAPELRGRAERVRPVSAGDRDRAAPPTPEGVPTALQDFPGTFRRDADGTLVLEQPGPAVRIRAVRISDDAYRP